jgi:hypothetical protein
MSAARQDFFPGFTLRRFTVPGTHDYSLSFWALKHILCMVKQFPLVKEQYSEIMKNFISNDAHQ